VKNQYFGDVNDYRKYGLLRILAAHPGQYFDMVLTKPALRKEEQRDLCD
jgi:hypothetical protein